MGKRYEQTIHKRTYELQTKLEFFSSSIISVSFYNIQINGKKEERTEEERGWMGGKGLEEKEGQVGGLDIGWEGSMGESGEAGVDMREEGARKGRRGVGNWCLVRFSLNLSHPLSGRSGLPPTPQQVCP